MNETSSRRETPAAPRLAAAKPAARQMRCLRHSRLPSFRWTILRPLEGLFSVEEHGGAAMNATLAVTRRMRTRSLHVLHRDEPVRHHRACRITAPAAPTAHVRRLTGLRRTKRAAIVTLGEIAERAYEIWLTDRGSSRLNHTHWRRAIDQIRRERGIR
jgi:hypothetical protein